MSENFNNIETRLIHMRKTSYGYSFYRSDNNSKNKKWIIKMNINNNQAVVKQSI